MMSTLVVLGGFFALTGAAAGLTEWRRRVKCDGPNVLAAGEPHDPTAATALARVDTIRLARSWWLWAGAAGSVALALVEGRPAYPGALLVGWLHPLLIGLFIATHRVVGTARGAGTEGVGDVAVDGRTQAVGQLVAAGTVAAAVGLVSVVAVLVALGAGGMFDTWHPSGLVLAQLVLAPLVMAGVAVAAARWWPHPAAAFVTLITVFFSPFSWVLGLHYFEGRRASERFEIVSSATVASHNVFLVGFLLWGTGFALLRSDRRPAVRVVCGAGAVVMTAGLLARAM